MNTVRQIIFTLLAMTAVLYARARSVNAAAWHGSGDQQGNRDSDYAWTIGPICRDGVTVTLLSPLESAPISTERFVAYLLYDVTSTTATASYDNEPLAVLGEGVTIQEQLGFVDVAVALQDDPFETDDSDRFPYTDTFPERISTRWYGSATIKWSSLPPSTAIAVTIENNQRYWFIGHVTDQVVA